MESSQQDLAVTLQSFIRDQLLGGSQEVALDDELLMDGIVDSVGVMRLTAFIEEKLGTKVPPQDFTIENFATISKLVDYLQRHAPSD